MPWILISFIFYLLTILVGWFINRKVGIALFIIFLMLFVFVLSHHMTDKLPISL
ncbi:DUF5993 family protein [Thiotrichales bacterium 19S11-10]|nr:DUF5993 family protein [Thiotrichales bacterium 19S11-10]MCF6807560.1 DUF5993 family protein [Thiotrichales bacterium 19S9-11]MCF6811529.1 DUF5993 family protein [Thiotrichales bacterium 19S9-12]